MKKGITVAKSAASSAASTIKQGWGGVPPIVKGIIYIVGAVIAYRVVKGIIKSSRLDPETRDSKQEEEGWNKEFVSESNKKPPTLTKTEMKSIANTLFNQMDGYGTRDYPMIDTFKRIKNNTDFAGVNAAYGIRTLQPGFGIGWTAPSFKGTLIESMQNEVDTSTIKEINTQLKKKGITYQI